jgi:hypothetical protein
VNQFTSQVVTKDMQDAINAMDEKIKEINESFVFAPPKAWHEAGSIPTAPVGPYDPKKDPNFGPSFLGTLPEELRDPKNWTKEEREAVATLLEGAADTLMRDGWCQGSMHRDRDTLRRVQTPLPAPPLTSLSSLPPLPPLPPATNWPTFKQVNWATVEIKDEQHIWKIPFDLELDPMTNKYYFEKESK